MKTMYSFSIAAITINDKQTTHIKITHIYDLPVLEVRSPLWVSRSHNPGVNWLNPILVALGKNCSLACSGVGITHFLEVVERKSCFLTSCQQGGHPYLLEASLRSLHTVHTSGPFSSSHLSDSHPSCPLLLSGTQVIR